MRVSLVVLLCVLYGCVLASASKSRNDEEMEGSGSGEEEITDTKPAKLTTTPIKGTPVKKQHHHHHHHHHHHGHHHHHHHHHNEKKTAKKSDTAAAPTATKKETTEEKEADPKLIKKTVGELAQTPLSKLMTLFKRGGVRTDIADQTIALLNASISNQNDLAEVYKKEEGLEDGPTLKALVNMTQADLAQMSQESETSKKSKTGKPKKKKETATKKSETETADSDDEKSGDKKSGDKKDKVEKSEKKNKTSKKDEIEVAKKTKVEYDIPGNIPGKCQKLVKNYANGELTLKDYLKAMKLCKTNEVEAAKLADTTPAQREAVNTMTMIQHEAYKYAMDSMRNFKSNSKDAESVMDQWRSNSFGSKAAVKKSDGVVPDAVKKFMGMQTPKSGKLGQPITANTKSLTPAAVAALAAQAAAANQKVAPLAPAAVKDALAAKSAIAAAAAAAGVKVNPKQIVKKSTIFQPLLNGKLPANVEEALIKKSLISQVPLINKKLLTNHMFLPNSVLNANLLAKKSVIQQKMLLAQMISKGLIDKNTLNPQVLKNVAKFTIPQSSKTPLNPANLPENIIEHPVPLPSEKTLIQAEGTDKIASAEKKSAVPKEKLLSVQKLTELDKAKPENKLLLGGLADTKSTVPSSLAAAVEKVKNSKDQKIPDISSSKIIKELTGKGASKDLTPDKIAAEEFFASLANPVLGNMPVDSSLVAAFKEQTKDNILSDPGKLFQVSRKRRTLRRTRSRHQHTIRSQKQRTLSKRNSENYEETRRSAGAVNKRKSSSSSSSSSHRHKRDTDYVELLSKRDTTDNLTRSVKPIERSNMGVHIASNNQGPKLLDKIRDMSRIIIH